MSTSHEPPPVVALINSTPDVIDMLRIAFEQAGYLVVSTFTHAIRDGEVDFPSFLAQHRPDVVVYDIAPPYSSNWRLFLHLRGLPDFRDRPVVLTSTNPARVKAEINSAQTIFEVIETPYMIMTLVDAVGRAIGRDPEVLAKRSPGSPGKGGDDSD